MAVQEHPVPSPASGEPPAGAPVTDREPASFRDPANQVFYADGQVLRGLRGQAVADWQALAATRFFSQLVAEGKLCPTEPVADDHGYELTLRHERVPFVSYPYEWTFSMLRDAARLHLEILDTALGERMTLKDGSAYNLQWRGAAPMFIDIGSFEQLREGEPWAGYRQFCQTMLFPLMLTAHTGAEFQPWLRARIDGIEAGTMRQLLGGGRRFKAGVFKHVWLQDAISQRMAGTSSRQISQEMREAGFSTELVRATVRALRKLVDKLDWRPPASHWQDYRTTCTYSEEDRQAKLCIRYHSG